MTLKPVTTRHGGPGSGPAAPASGWLSWRVCCICGTRFRRARCVLPDINRRGPRAPFLDLVCWTCWQALQTGRSPSCRGGGDSPRLAGSKSPSPPGG